MSVCNQSLTNIVAKISSTDMPFINTLGLNWVVLSLCMFYLSFHLYLYALLYPLWVYCNNGLRLCVYYHPSGNSYRSLTQTKVLFIKVAEKLTLARLDIFSRQQTQQMFLTSSPASALSDDIGNRGTFHKANDCLLLLAATVSPVNARLLTGSARGNNRACGARSIITQRYVTSVAIHVAHLFHAHSTGIWRIWFAL